MVTTHFTIVIAYKFVFAFYYPIKQYLINGNMFNYPIIITIAKSHCYYNTSKSMLKKQLFLYPIGMLILLNPSSENPKQLTRKINQFLKLNIQYNKMIQILLIAQIILLHQKKKKDQYFPPFLP